MKKIISLVVMVLFFGHTLLLAEAFSPSWSKYYSESVGRDNVYNRGYFYFYIESGDKKSQVKIQLDYAGEEKDLSEETMCVRTSSKPTYWKAKILTSSSDRFVENNHNIRFSNGTDTCYVWTKIDQDNLYAVYVLPLLYDMPAHYEYDTYDTKRADITARLNFNYYSANNDLQNSAKKTGYHKSKETTREITIQANTAHVGTRSNGQNGYRYYGATIALSLKPKKRRADVLYQYYDEGTKQWITHDSYTKSVYDAQVFSVRKKTIYGYIPPDSVEVEDNSKIRTMDMNQISICKDSTIKVIYSPWKYTVEYLKNTTDTVTDMPQAQEKVFSKKFKISSLVPQRSGYTFAGWMFEGDLYQPNDRFLHEQNGGVAQLLAKWDPIKEIRASEGYYKKNDEISVIDLIKENAAVNYIGQKCQIIDDYVYYNGTKTNLKVVVTKIKYTNDYTVSSPTNLDTTTELNDVEVSYALYEGDNKVDEAIGKVHILGDIPDRVDVVPTGVYIRYIADLALSDGTNAKDTLQHNSIWKNDTMYNNSLRDSLSNANPVRLDDLIN